MAGRQNTLYRRWPDLRVSEQHRLSERNPTFRGNLLVTEGGTAGTAILSQSDGVLLQELPFAVELKKFIVE